MKKLVSILLIIIAFFSTSTLYIYAEETYDFYDNSIYEKFSGQGVSLYVYNWGEYISIGEDDLMDTNAEFEKLTGIKIFYTTYATNEEMYAKLKSGIVSYDIIIPSDYMIGKMIEEDMILKLDFSNIPNYEYIMSNFKDLEYDINNEYSVPYTWGLVGIFYNKDMVDEEVDSWSIFWDEKYKNNMIMFYNPRDAFGIGQKILGYSFNTENPEELDKTLELMKEQKSFVQSYAMDEIFNKMNNGEAVIAPYYNGDARIMVEENDNIGFAYPKEGTNMFVDAICIPSSAKNKEAAELYINFLCEPEVALANSEYMGYATPNILTFEMLDEETKNNPIFYPDESVINNSEVYNNLSNETNKKVNDMWIELMREDGGNKESSISTVLVIMIISIVLIVLFPLYRRIKKMRISKFV